MWWISRSITVLVRTLLYRQSGPTDRMGGCDSQTCLLFPINFKPVWWSSTVRLVGVSIGFVIASLVDGDSGKVSVEQLQAYSSVRVR